MAPQGIEFTPVSRSLTTVRLISAGIWTVIPMIVMAVLAVMLHPVFWSGAVGCLVLLVWLVWLLPRQVRAMAWAEGPSEFFIRKGVLFRSMTVVPYGRIQYVDVTQGPVARFFSMSTVALHTASPETAGTIDGIPSTEAARLRDMLAQRGSAELAGL
ncbi:PH domain-containing protein [Schaalia sp. 19OD2882]|nr:PH domain-containing protein [Schaalia sp. 19OD2882]